LVVFKLAVGISRDNRQAVNSVFEAIKQLNTH